MYNQTLDKGVCTGMTGAIVNLCIQSTILCIPIANFFALLNAFPTIALVFAIISASTSTAPEKRQFSLRFADKARKMNAIGTLLNLVAFVCGGIAFVVAFS